MKRGRRPKPLMITFPDGRKEKCFNGLIEAAEKIGVSHITVFNWLHRKFNAPAGYKVEHYEPTPEERFLKYIAERDNNNND